MLSSKIMLLLYRQDAEQKRTWKFCEMSTAMMLRDWAWFQPETLPSVLRDPVMTFGGAPVIWLGLKPITCCPRAVISTELTVLMFPASDDEIWNKIKITNDQTNYSMKQLRNNSSYQETNCKADWQSFICIFFCPTPYPSLWGISS